MSEHLQETRRLWNEYYEKPWYVKMWLCLLGRVPIDPYR
jgi:hypothetical protein